MPKTQKIQEISYKDILIGFSVYAGLVWGSGGDQNPVTNPLEQRGAHHFLLDSVSTSPYSRYWFRLNKLWRFGG